MNNKITTVTVASSGSLSGVIRTRELVESTPVGRPLVSVYTPAAVEATTARLIWHASMDDGSTWTPLYDDAGAVLYTVIGTSQCVHLDSDLILRHEFLKCQTANSSNAAVTQTSNRVFYFEAVGI